MIYHIVILKLIIYAVKNKAWRPKVEGDPRVSAAICKEGFQAPPETQSCWILIKLPG